MPEVRGVLTGKRTRTQRCWSCASAFDVETRVGRARRFCFSFAWAERRENCVYGRHDADPLVLVEAWQFFSFRCVEGQPGDFPVLRTLVKNRGRYRVECASRGQRHLAVPRLQGGKNKTVPTKSRRSAPRRPFVPKGRGARAQKANCAYGASKSAKMADGFCFVLSLWQCVFEFVSTPLAPTSRNQRV